MPVSLTERIKKFNQGREPERLQVKYEKMRSNAFAFLRATCHLFYEDWQGNDQLDDAPLAWICGDLHLENFGVYKAGNRLTYFDINDFDEAVLAPCTWDLARFLTSVLLAAKTLEIKKQEAIFLCELFLKSYTTAIGHGKAQWAERENPVEVVQNLINQLAQRNREQLLQQRTYLDQGTRRLNIDNEHTLPLLQGQRELITGFMPEFATQYLEEQQTESELCRQLDGIQTVTAEFFTLLDVARRISGGGSLGLERYVLLVEGEGSPDSNYLLDLKQARPSSLELYLKKKWRQLLIWSNPAQRIVSIQNQVQGFSPALLNATHIGKTPYVLKELQPTKAPTDRVELKKLGSSAQLEKLMTLMGRVVAWGELRSSGRQGAADIDELIDFAVAKGWQKQLVEYAQYYSKQVRDDWKEFAEAFDDGLFK